MGRQVLRRRLVAAAGVCSVLRLWYYHEWNFSTLGNNTTQLYMVASMRFDNHTVCTYRHMCTIIIILLLFRDYYSPGRNVIIYDLILIPYFSWTTYSLQNARFIVHKHNNVILRVRMAVPISFSAAWCRSARNFFSYISQ